MPFRFYTNLLSEASRTLAMSVLVVGLLLIGFGMLIMAFPELFAFLAAAVFFLAGVGCATVAVKMLWARRRFEKHMSRQDDAYRENVTIHHDRFHDF
ncbi:MAG: hypothetical protein JW955_23690 [Sedimentisphaerales bacterium]|nr:hypothetical protein [Sedimentisphaerales bacterium]